MHMQKILLKVIYAYAEDIAEGNSRRSVLYVLNTCSFAVPKCTNIPEVRNWNHLTHSDFFYDFLSHATN